MEQYINTIIKYHKTYNFCNLSLWIDKYLIPRKNEKNKMLKFLRKEMIDKIPDEFWKK